MERLDFLHGDPVIAVHRHFSAQLTEILHEVVGEGVVIIENEDHLRVRGRRFSVSVFRSMPERACAISMARNSALPLLSVSSYSRSGTESATIPAPTWT